jgi:hypothetical protein
VTRQATEAEADEAYRQRVRKAMLEACNTGLPLVWDVGLTWDSAGLCILVLFVEPVYLELVSDEAEALAGLELAAGAALVHKGIVREHMAGSVDIRVTVREAPVLGFNPLEVKP